MKYFFTVLAFIFLLHSCTFSKKSKIDVSHIRVSVNIDRFDQSFFNADSLTIGKVRQDYQFLFPGNEPDSTWLRRKNDSLSQALYVEVQKVFGNFEQPKKELIALFKHIKYYYPAFQSPKIITLISNLDMDYQVIYKDSLLLLSLDTYLGENSPFYINYPDYLKSNYNKKVLPLHVARKIAEETLPKIPYRVFLDRMIAAGKLQYAVQSFLPEISTSELFIYTPKQLQWAEDNEEKIWEYFVEKEYLFSTDKELKVRFLDPAPFSKFYLASDNQSPGGIAAWIGYRIVQAYMKNYDVSLQELMATTPIEIFNKSKYKPKR